MTRYFPVLFIGFLFALSFSASAFESIFGTAGDVSDLGSRLLPPSSAHILGTDELGRDLFIRILKGGQISLTVALVAALAATTLGTAIGTIAGYIGGRTDAALMRMTDILISLPALPLLIVLSAIDPEKIGLSAGGSGFWKIVFLVSLLGWTTTARLARARTLTIRNMDYVRAAKALGVSDIMIILRHILPNLSGTIAVAAALATGNVILMESVLSFLGLGIQPPTASWGNMLSNAEETMWETARLTFWPGLMIFLTVLSFNFIGDSAEKKST